MVIAFNLNHFEKYSYRLLKNKKFVSFFVGTIKICTFAAHKNFICNDNSTH